MKENFYKVLGKKVRKIRKEAGMTQRELSIKTGISQSEISRFESRGEQIRAADRIFTILEVLGCEISISESGI